MENKENAEFQKIAIRFQRISEELFEEWKLEHPSYYRLEISASEIMQVLEESKIEDDKFQTWKSWKTREIEIFKTDLVGKLHHDYNKRLVRYKGKWENEKNKIDKLISEFRQKFGNNNL